jgi:hypothetical protein
MFATAALPLSPQPPQLYRLSFTAAECKMLDECPVESALSEISLLRILLVRLLAAARRIRRLSLERHLAMLSAFNGASLILASLVRFQDKYLRLTIGDPFLNALAELDPDDL